MTYHASYEQAGTLGSVTQFRIVAVNGAVSVTSVRLDAIGCATNSERLPTLDPTAARWLAHRLLEAAEEMES